MSKFKNLFTVAVSLLLLFAVVCNGKRVEASNMLARMTAAPSTQMYLNEMAQEIGSRGFGIVAYETGAVTEAGAVEMTPILSDVTLEPFTGLSELEIRQNSITQDQTLFILNYENMKNKVIVRIGSIFYSLSLTPEQQNTLDGLMNGLGILVNLDYNAETVTIYDARASNGHLDVTRGENDLTTVTCNGQVLFSGLNSDLNNRVQILQGNNLCGLVEVFIGQAEKINPRIVFYDGKYYAAVLSYEAIEDYNAGTFDVSIISIMQPDKAYKYKDGQLVELVGTPMATPVNSAHENWLGGLKPIIILGLIIVIGLPWLILIILAIKKLSRRSRSGLRG